MLLADRQVLFKKIEALRKGRILICFFNFDRGSNPNVQGLSTIFHAEAKEALFRVLKESVKSKQGVDLCLYTRGGDTNSVWPIVSLIREFDQNFEVLVPFRCHSSGTLVALGAKSILLGPLSELSPIDPSTGNQFNPVDVTNPQIRLPISVEDVKAYTDFVLQYIKPGSKNSRMKETFPTFLQKLSSDVHPLALGNVHRAHNQIKLLARNLLELHPVEKRTVEKVVDSLATRFYSHLHMINRHEAKDILGSNHIEFASDDLSNAMDELLRAYEDTFKLRTPFFLANHMGNDIEKSVRFIGAVVESKNWSYHFETKAQVTQYSKLPTGVQVQVPPGQRMPIVPGLPREYSIEITAQGWMHNKNPQGVTL